MAKLKVKDKAPNFALKDKAGKEISPSDYEADFFVIYFYPKDNTPGCTIEAKEFSKALAKFKKLNTVIIGISGGDEKSKQTFCKKHSLKVTLVSDPDFKVSKKYASYGKKQFMGRTYDGILRKTYLLDSKMKVVKIYEKVSPDSHAEEILKDIKAIGS